MPIAITNTLANGNVVDAPQLNANFLDLAEPLRGDEDMDVIIRQDSPTLAPLTLNQAGAGPIQVNQKNGSIRQTIDNNGNLIIKHADDPSITLDNDDASVDRFARWKATDAGLLVLESDTGNIYSIDLNTRILTFNQQPVVPAKNRWCANFFIPDIAARGVDGTFEEIQGALIPGSKFTATHIQAKATFGTASGSFSIEFRKVPFGSLSQTNLGTVTLNPGTIGVGVEVDIADHLFTENDHVFTVITAINSSLHKSVWVSIKGFYEPQ